MNPNLRQRHLPRHLRGKNIFFVALAHSRLDIILTHSLKSRPSPPPRPTPRHATLPSASLTPTVNEQALAKVRLQAEKYKPKTPSSLRTTSRYSGSYASVSPLPALSEPELEDFGTDQFAEDAQWLYANCPSGNMEDLVWPRPEPLQTSLGIELSVDMAEFAKMNMDGYYGDFHESLEEFKKSFI